MESTRCIAAVEDQIHQTRIALASVSRYVAEYVCCNVYSNIQKSSLLGTYDMWV